MRLRHRMGNWNFAAGIVLVMALPLLASQDLPERKEKAILKKVCTGCHVLEAALASRRTEIGWQQNVDDMISRGAEGSDEEMAAVVEYLTEYFGKLNVNTASQKRLQDFLGFTDKEAEAIITYRDRNGKI